MTIKISYECSHCHERGAAVQAPASGSEQVKIQIPRGWRSVVLGDGTSSRPTCDAVVCGECLPELLGWLGGEESSP